MQTQAQAGHVSAPPPRTSRIWQLKKQALERELRVAVERSPILELHSFQDLGTEIRALVFFLTRTLVRPGPGGEVSTSGPVLLGLRYAESFLRTPPGPGAVAVVLLPPHFYHPNSGPGNGLCLGVVPCGLSMTSILHMCLGALSLSSFRTEAWLGWNQEAAAFVRAHASEFPLLSTGLFEEPPPHQRIGSEYISPAFLSLLSQVLP